MRRRDTVIIERNTGGLRYMNIENKERHKKEGDRIALKFT
jgi:hypothetical protein